MRIYIQMQINFHNTHETKPKFQTLAITINNL